MRCWKLISQKAHCGESLRSSNIDGEVAKMPNTTVNNGATSGSPQQGAHDRLLDLLLPVIFRIYYIDLRGQKHLIQNSFGKRVERSRVLPTRSLSGTTTVQQSERLESCVARERIPHELTRRLFSSLFWLCSSGNAHGYIFCTKQCVHGTPDLDVGKTFLCSHHLRVFSAHLRLLLCLHVYLFVAI